MAWAPQGSMGHLQRGRPWAGPPEVDIGEEEGA